jgi:hypothetical protein
MENMGVAYLSGADYLSYLPEVGVKTPVKANLQLNPTPLDSSQGLVNFSQIKGNRLFTQNMLAGFGRFANKLGMGVGTGADNHRLNRGVVQNSAMIAERCRDVKIGCTLFGGFQKNIGNSYKVSLGDSVS